MSQHLSHNAGQGQGLNTVMQTPLPLQEQQRLYGALYALRLMTRKYEFRDAEERIPLEVIVQTTFPTLLQVFQVYSAIPPFDFSSRWRH